MTKNGNGVRLLNLGYSRSIARNRLQALERHARATGMDLETLELLGQDPRILDGFLHAAGVGRAREFLQRIDLLALRGSCELRALGISLIDRRVTAET